MGFDGYAAKGRVLVAEDNISFAFVLRLAIEREGLEVVIAHDGAEALERLRTEEFDLLITDEQMPRLSGRGLCEKLRQDPVLRDLPVFFCTAKAWDIECTRLEEDLGVVDVFLKPFSPRRVARTIADFLAQPGWSSPSSIENELLV